MSSTLRGALLAGGASRRIGSDKALLELDGDSLIARAARALTAVAIEVAVVGGEPEAYSDLGLAAVPDERAGLGPLAGIHAALGHWPGRAVLVLACDLPFAGESLLRHLASLAQADLETDGGSAPRAWVPEQDGRLQPLCAVYSPGCREPADRALSAPPRSVHSLLEIVTVRRVPLTPELSFFRPELLLNVNRPGDLERARSAATPQRRAV